MRKTAKRLVSGAGVLVGLLVLAVVAFALSFNLDHYKPQIEAAVAKSTGMQLEIRGKAALSILPHFGIALQDVRLVNQGTELFQTNKLTIAPRLAPLLLHRDVIIDNVILDRPDVKIEKSAEGHMNFEVASQASEKASSPAKSPEATESADGRQEVHSLNINDGSLSYIDRGTGQTIQLAGLNATLSDLVRTPSAKGEVADPIGSLSLKAKIQAKTLKAGQVAASRLRTDVQVDHGLVRLDNTEANAFGGDFRGLARIDLRGKTPKLEITQKGSHIDLAQVSSGSKINASGLADAEVNLTASGKDERSIEETAKGTVGIRSNSVTVPGIDIDDLASKLKTAQGLDLVRLGSALVSGPLAPATQAAGIAGGAKEEKSVIHPLVAEWTVSGGFAETKDVAIATDKTRIAFKGKVNLVSKTYQDFFVATVDGSGCSKIKVEVEGSLSNPRPSAGSIGEQITKSYAGQLGSSVGSKVGSLGNAIGGLLSSKTKAQPPAAASTCDHFYTGSALTA